MGGWFQRKTNNNGIRANRIVADNAGAVAIDVRGQTCPGYLLAINRAVDELPPDTRADLWITYPPCGDDVHAWCKSRGIELLDIATGEDMTVITVHKPADAQTN